MEQIRTKAFTPTVEVVGGVISAVFSAVALFMYHWSIVLLTAFCIVLMAVLPALFSGELTTKTMKTSEEKSSICAMNNPTIASNGYPIASRIP